MTLPDGTHPRSSFGLVLALGLGLHGLMILGGSYMQHLAAMARVVKRRSEARECPCCGYGFAGIAPEADGARICPECGAAWRFNLNGTVMLHTVADRRPLRHA